MLLGILSIVIGYLLGSLPTAYIIGHLRKGIDIRRVDSGNVGAAAVMRQVGVWEGIAVGFIDIAKGAVALIIARALGVAELWVLAAGFSALLGHNFPVFLRFRGGSGAATTLGIFLVLAPKAVLVVLVIVAIPFFTTRNFAFTIFVGFALLPLLIWLFGGSVVVIFYSLAIDIFMVARNLPVLKRAWPKRVKRGVAANHRQRQE
jgi:glycerol-3-phosphate acyltransferase PlsY